MARDNCFRLSRGEVAAIAAMIRRRTGSVLAAMGLLLAGGLWG